MEHQPRVAAEEPCRVDAQGEIARCAQSFVARDVVLGLAIAPAAVHHGLPYVACLPGAAAQRTASNGIVEHGMLARVVQEPGMVSTLCREIGTT